MKAKTSHIANPQVKKKLAAASQQLQAGNWQVAATLYQQILHSHPTNAEAWHFLGIIIAQQGKAQDAIHYLQQAIKYAPHIALYHVNLGIILRSLGDQQTAITCQQKALSLEPKNAIAHGNLAVCYYETGELEKSVAHYQLALKYESKSPDLYNNYAATLLAQGQIESAIEYYQKAIRLNPAFAAAYVSLTHVLQLVNRLDEAVQMGKKALQLDARDISAYINLAEALIKQKKYDEAIEILQKAKNIEPDHAGIYFTSGNVYKALKEYDTAIAYYQQTLQLVPNHANAHCNLGTVYQAQQQVEQAIAHYQQAIAINPQHVEVYNNLGTLSKEQGDVDQAISYFTQALALRPQQVDLHENIAKSFRLKNQLDKSLYHYEQAITHYEKMGQCDLIDYAAAHFSKAWLHLIQKEFATGWQSYSYRPSRSQASQKKLDALTTVLTENLHNQRFLILREQGLGDELFFLRFAPILKARGAWIAYECGPKIHSILTRQTWIDQLIIEGESLPNVDHILLVGDLPLFLGMATVEQVPVPLPLTVLPERVASMRVRLENAGKSPYFGITWQAGGKIAEKVEGDAGTLYKEIELTALAQALQSVNYTFLALQRNPEEGEITTLADLLGQPVHDFTDLNDNLEDMLALLWLLDEYVGVSNTNMHLRAGLAKTAHVLVPYPPEWRWMHVGNESVWFKGFPVYRQSQNGDWSPALQQLQADI